MEKLEISDCDSFEKVFDIQVLPMNECIILPFKSLRSVDVLYCSSLTSIFSASLTPTLQQLQRLQIQNCDKSDLFGFNNTQQQLNDVFVKLNSSLDYCLLRNEGGLKLKKKNQRLTVKIVGGGLEVPPILFALLKSFSKLDKVEVSSYSVIQLFPCNPHHLDVADMDSEAKTLACIGHLKLTKLSNMKHIWSEHSPLKYHVVPQVLQVEDCDSLLSLAPPSPTLFKNLTTLVVWRCPMLIKLVSIIKSLVNLEKMTIGKCDSLEEIVCIDDDQWGEGVASSQECIVFDKLEVLQLQHLKSVASFCSTSNCNFRFPSLNRVLVMNCPKMKFFSNGDLTTPKLIRVWPCWVSEHEEERKQNEARWEGDLNSTIRQLFEEKVTTMDEDED